jgi:hypothetical protein
MRVQIAFNSENLDFTIANTAANRNNCTFLKAEKARGKVSVTIKTDEDVEVYYLYIFKRAFTRTETFLNNYAFKYINAKSEDEIYDYPILNNDPSISYTESKEEDYLDVIKCTFNRIDVEPGTANITYFFKVVYNQTHYYGEDVNTVAVTESPYYTVYKRNPDDVDGKITLTARGDLSNWAYLNVIAQIQQNNVLEYVAYNGVKIIRPPPEGTGEEASSDHSALFIVIGVILLLIVCGLIGAILYFQFRNQKLLTQVKQVSFQKTNSQTDPMLDSQSSSQ